MIDGITTYGSDELINQIKYGEPVFICVIGTTETSKIPGISGAGATPELTEYTPAADAEIIEALKLSCAWEFVSELPDTINSEIKERGGGFSEGQAQRLSIARAILRKSPILLLDEATSALDVTTERNVLKNIMKDDYPRTCIVTTHRPTVLTMCDRVYSIHDMQCTLLNDDEIEEITRNF